MKRVGGERERDWADESVENEASQNHEKYDKKEIKNNP